MGRGCTQENSLGIVARENCAWPARFSSWLQAKFPRTDIEVVNEAVPGMPSAGYLAVLGFLVQKVLIRGPIDVVITDLTINDGQRATAFGFASQQNYEQLIRSLRQLLPRAP